MFQVFAQPVECIEGSDLGMKDTCISGRAQCAGKTWSLVMSLKGLMVMPQADQKRVGFRSIAMIAGGETNGILLNMAGI